MFTDTHIADVSRLMALGHPLPYIYLCISLLYLFMLAPGARFFCQADLLTSNKIATPSRNRLDQDLLLGILAGTFVLLQSNTANMVVLSISLFHSVLFRHPL